MDAIKIQNNNEVQDQLSQAPAKMQPNPSRIPSLSSKQHQCTAAVHSTAEGEQCLHRVNNISKLRAGSVSRKTWKAEKYGDVFSVLYEWNKT